MESWDPEEAKTDHSELCGACAIGYRWEKVSLGTGKDGDGLSQLLIKDGLLSLLGERKTHPLQGLWCFPLD